MCKERLRCLSGEDSGLLRGPGEDSGLLVFKTVCEQMMALSECHVVFVCVHVL